MAQQWEPETEQGENALSDAEMAFQSVPEDGSISWSDPRAARFRRAVGREAHKRGLARRELAEAKAEIDRLRGEIRSAEDLVRTTMVNYQSLQTEYRNLYVEYRAVLERGSAEDSEPDGIQSPGSPSDQDQDQLPE